MLNKVGNSEVSGKISNTNNLSLDAMMRHANSILKKCCFKISPTQRKTPNDCNSAAFAIADQLNNHDVEYLASSTKIHPYELRDRVVSSLPQMIQNGKFEWIAVGIGSPKEWLKKFSINGQVLDEVFLELASRVSRRCILVLHVMGQNIITHD